MPKIEYTNGLPVREEFQRAVREAIENYDPVEELLELHTELGEFERRYGLSSEECYSRFTAGQMGDDVEIFEWVARLTSYCDPLYDQAHSRRGLYVEQFRIRRAESRYITNRF